MSEERLTRIENTLTEVRTDVEELRSGQAELRTDVQELRSGQTELRAEVRDLGHQMRVLHEDVIDRIKAIPDPTEVLRRAMKTGFSELRDEMNRRIDPLELTVREHSIELARLKDSRA